MSGEVSRGSLFAPRLKVPNYHGRNDSQKLDESAERLQSSLQDTAFHKATSACNSYGMGLPLFHRDETRITNGSSLGQIFH